MDSTGIAGYTQVTQEVVDSLQGSHYEFRCRGQIKVKGKGEMVTFFFCDQAMNGEVRGTMLPSFTQSYPEEPAISRSKSNSSYQEQQHPQQSQQQEFSNRYAKPQASMSGLNVNPVARNFQQFNITENPHDVPLTTIATTPLLPPQAPSNTSHASTNTRIHHHAAYLQQQQQQHQQQHFHQQPEVVPTAQMIHRNGNRGNGTASTKATNGSTTAVSASGIPISAAASHYNHQQQHLPPGGYRAEHEPLLQQPMAASRSHNPPKYEPPRYASAHIINQQQAPIGGAKSHSAAGTYADQQQPRVHQQMLRVYMKPLPKLPGKLY